MGIVAKNEVSLVASFALVCSASIGTGVLILSYGVMQAGLILGTLFVILASICGALTESILVSSALKLNASSLTSLIARTVAYSVIREKRLNMKKRSKKTLNKDYSSIKTNFENSSRDNSVRNQLGKTIFELESQEKHEFNEISWNEISDVESSISDLECVRNVLINNSSLFNDFKLELKNRLVFHSKILNILILILIGYCIPTYFILFSDYVEDLFKQLSHTLLTDFSDKKSAFWIASIIECINNRVALNFICFILVYYTSYQPDISKIAKLGFLSLFSFIVFLFSVLYRFFVSPFKEHLNNIPEKYELGAHMGFLTALKVFNFAIYCFYSHLICVQAVTNIKNINYKKAVFITISTTSLLLSICISLSTVLNFEFGKSLLPNPTLNYSPFDTVIAIARFVSALTMLVVIPMHVIPFMDSLKNLYFLDKLTDEMMNEIEEAMILIEKDSEPKCNRRSQQSVSSYFTLIGDQPRTEGTESLGEYSCPDELADSHIFERFFNSCYFRKIGVFIFLIISITLALIAKNAAQYVELFTGFFDTIIIIIYPLFIYKNIWMHRMSLFANVLIFGYLIFYELCALSAGIYTIYEHIFL